MSTLKLITYCTQSIHRTMRTLKFPTNHFDNHNFILYIFPLFLFYNLDIYRAVLDGCAALETLDLTSCRGLPRGVKRLYSGKKQLRKLKEALEDSSDTDIHWY